MRKVAGGDTWGCRLGWDTQGCRRGYVGLQAGLGYAGLQTGIRGVAGWDTWGCRLGYVGVGGVGCVELWSSRTCSWGMAPRPKIGSRYTHFRWMGLSCARAPSRVASLVAYCWTVSAKPPKKGDSRSEPSSAIISCNRRWCRLQPWVVQAATVGDAGCNRLKQGLRTTHYTVYQLSTSG